MEIFPVALVRPILDAGYSMLDNLHDIRSRIYKHPVSSLPGRSSERAETGNQYRGSANGCKVFRRDNIDFVSHVLDDSLYITYSIYA